MLNLFLAEFVSDLSRFLGLDRFGAVATFVRLNENPLDRKCAQSPRSEEQMAVQDLVRGVAGVRDGRMEARG